MAVMNDEICQNEMEGNQIGDKAIASQPGEEPPAGTASPFGEDELNQEPSAVPAEIADMRR